MRRRYQWTVHSREGNRRCAEGAQRRDTQTGQQWPSVSVSAMALCPDPGLRMRASVPPLLLQALDEMKRKLKELEDEAIRLKQAVQVRNLAAPQTRRALLAPHKAYATVRDASQEQAEV